MGYKLRYLVREQETGHEIISSLESAKAIAEKYADYERFQSAEVIDSEGAVVFRRPRTVSCPKGS
jgi:hypothetical protein